MWEHSQLISRIMIHVEIDIQLASFDWNYIHFLASYEYKVIWSGFTLGCKHSKVDNSWSLHKFKWKWFGTIPILTSNLLIKDHKHLKKNIDLQSQAIYVDKKIFKRSTYLRGQYKWCASGDIEQVVVKKMFKVR